MTTNATKHGALSVRDGGIDVRWHIDQDGACVLLWCESNGPPVKPPTKIGLGSTLILRQIPFELGGEVNVAYEPQGAKISMRIPAKNVSILQSVTAVRKPTTATVMAPSDDTIEGMSFLLVEDSLLVALQTEAVVRRAGAKHVTVCSSTEQALAFLAKERPDIAILDINLAGDTSMAIADVLMAAGIPFVFATGYGAGEVLQERFRDVPILSKPYGDRLVLAAIKTLAASVNGMSAFSTFETEPGSPGLVGG